MVPRNSMPTSYQILCSAEMYQAIKFYSHHGFSHSEMLRLILSTPRCPVFRGACVLVAFAPLSLAALSTVSRAVARLVFVCQGRSRSEAKVDHV